MSAMRHKMPPYSKMLAQQLEDRMSWRKYDGTSIDAEHITIWAIIGPEGWRVAKTGNAPIQFSALSSGGPWEGHRLFLLLPPSADPYDFDWRQLATGDPVLICRAGEVSQEEVHHLSDALLRDGVSSVISDSPTGLLRYSLSQRAA